MIDLNDYAELYLRLFQKEASKQLLETEIEEIREKLEQIDINLIDLHPDAPDSIRFKDN